jgi:uncharacterized repeat protein (TIGR03806 family)
MLDFLRHRHAAEVPLGVAVLLALSACNGSSNGPGTPAPSPRPTAGLDSRPRNLSCLAPSRVTSGNELVALERVFGNLAFDQPLALVQAPGDTLRWFVLEKGTGGTARVRSFVNDPDVQASAVFAALGVAHESEGGLLGMAFHPDHAANGEVFLSWTETGSGPFALVSRIARFRSLDGGQTLDPGTLEEILRVDQDFANHNGGQIAFGPDGYLYAGFGDGGGAGDPNGRAQDTTNLLGAILRLDVEGGAPYSIPAGATGNPFAGNPICGSDHSGTHDCPEIYAWGLRNPWRWSFDRATGALWVGDVGQGAWEEVNRIERGGNYGWDCREGAAPFAGSRSGICATAAGRIDPVHAYSRDAGNSITGGYVYRGTQIPGLIGRYVFGDFGSGRVWSLDNDGPSPQNVDLLLDTNLAIASFAEDHNGELYVVDFSGGGLYRLVAGQAEAPDGSPLPLRLSETGCVNAASPATAAQGLIPYEVAAPFWSDGADKERWLAVPDGSTIDVAADGDFDAPPGSVLMKHFRLGTRLVETRLLMRHPDGVWAGYTYEWDAAQTDAVRVDGGKRTAIGNVDWIFPSGAECMICHTAAAGFSLGLETAQLNHPLAYPGGRTANQLATLDAIALLGAPLNDPAVLPALVDPYAGGPTIERRARAYLHTNCAQCHRPTGVGDLDFRYATLLDHTNACDRAPQAGSLGIADARIIAPGDPDRSTVVARMRVRDAHAMPPLGSTRSDADGIDLIATWIAGLVGCQ